MQIRSAETRDKVLDATRALLMTRAITEVTMKHVQDVSGVSNGSIFHHFGSKDGIIGAVFASERSEYIRRVTRAIEDFQGDPCDALGAGAAAAVRFHARDPQRFLRLVAAFANSEWLSLNEPMVVTLAAEIEAPITAWSAPHVASGALPDLTPALFESALLGPAEHTTRLWVHRGMPGPLEDYAPTVGRFVAAGFRALCPQPA